MNRKLALCAALLLYLSHPQAAPYYSVTKDNINIRSDATILSPSLGYLSKKDRVEVLGERYEWYNIVLPERFKGFVWGAYIRRLSRKKGEVIASRLNIRQKPSLEALIIGQLPQETVVVIRNKVGDWLQIDAYPHATGWVHKQFLRKETPEMTVKQEGFSEQVSLSSFITSWVEALSTATAQEKMRLQDELVAKGENVIPLLERFLPQAEDNLIYSIIAVFTDFARNDPTLISYFLKKADTESPRIASVYLDTLQNVLQPQGPKKAFFYLSSHEALSLEDIQKARNSLRAIHKDKVLERGVGKLHEPSSLQSDMTNQSLP